MMQPVIFPEWNATPLVRHAFGTTLLRFWASCQPATKCISPVPTARDITSQCLTLCNAMEYFGIWLASSLAGIMSEIATLLQKILFTARVGNIVQLFPLALLKLDRFFDLNVTYYVPVIDMELDPES